MIVLKDKRPTSSGVFVLIQGHPHNFSEFTQVTRSFQLLTWSLFSTVLYSKRTKKKRNVASRDLEIYRNEFPFSDYYIETYGGHWVPIVLRLFTSRFTKGTLLRPKFELRSKILLKPTCVRPPYILIVRLHPLENHQIIFIDCFMLRLFYSLKNRSL